MKIQITTRKSDDVQRFFSAPLTFSQKVTVKKLLIVEQILERMKALGLNRSKLAARMEVSPARVTTMMDGTNNFTIETLMRAADAVDGELALTIIPKGHQVKCVTWQDSDVHASFVPARQPVAEPAATFALSEPVREDYTDAA
jgi:transcriptional regulator with XRE-family HTH domain